MSENTEFKVGSVAPTGDCGMFEAGIDHVSTNASSPVHPERWHSRIVVYGCTEQEATELRDRILVALWK